MTLLTVCLEGTKGAGKTTTITLLKQALEDQGVQVTVFAPFQAANAFAETQGFAGAVPMINASVQDNMTEIEFLRHSSRQAIEAAQAAADKSGRPSVLLFDRGWVTMQPHLYGGAWKRSLGADSPAIDAIWQQVLAEAPVTYFLQAHPSVTRQRRPALDAVSGLETDEKFLADYNGRMAMAKRYADKIALMVDTGTMPQTKVVKALTNDVRSRLGMPIVPVAPVAPVAPESPLIP